MAATAAAAAVRLPMAAQPRLAAAEVLAAGGVRVRQQLRPIMGITAASTGTANHFPLAAAPRRLRGHLLLAAVAEDQEEAVVAVEAEEGLEDGVAEGESASGEVETGGVQAAASTKLYFGNLPYNCDSAQLAGIVQEYASPEMIEVLYDRDTGRSRGFAFVTMSSKAECETVIQNLDGSEFSGRILRVNYADQPKPKAPLYPETEHKIFVGNLAWSVTADTLREVFQEYGNVVGTRVIYDGDSGRSRGYGFVCYSTKEEMDTALETLDGVEIEGRAIRLSLALGKRS